MINKYTLNSTAITINGNEYDSPVFYRGDVTYKRFQNAAIIQVVFEANGEEVGEQYFPVDCYGDWLEAEAENAMLTQIPCLQDHTLLG